MKNLTNSYLNKLVIDNNKTTFEFILMNNVIYLETESSWELLKEKTTLLSSGNYNLQTNIIPLLKFIPTISINGIIRNKTFLNSPILKVKQILFHSKVYEIQFQDLTLQLNKDINVFKKYEEIKENFDCTQIVTFNGLQQNISYFKLLNNIFTNLNIKKKNNIRKAKIEYCKNYLYKFIFEIDNEDFFSQLETWRELDKVPYLIDDYVNNIINLIRQGNISNCNIILIDFAEIGETKEIIVQSRINKDDLLKSLYLLSIYNDNSVAPNNLVINIDCKLT